MLVQALGTIPLVHVLGKPWHIRFDHGRIRAANRIATTRYYLDLIQLLGLFLCIFNDASLLNRRIHSKNCWASDVIGVYDVALLEYLHLLRVFHEFLIGHEQLLLLLVMDCIICVVILIHVSLRRLFYNLLLQCTRLSKLLVRALNVDVVGALSVHQVLVVLLAETSNIALD